MAVKHLVTKGLGFEPALFLITQGLSSAAASATTAIWPPHRLRPKRIILPDGRVLVARTDADYQLAIRMALESRQAPESEEAPGETPRRAARPRKPKRRVVEVSSLPEPDGAPSVPAGFYDGFARLLSARLSDQIRHAELLRLWSQHRAEQEEEEAIVLLLLGS